MLKPVLLIGLFTCILGECPRIPSIYHSKVEKFPGDNGYKIKINGDPDKYIPGKLYTCKCFFSFNLIVLNYTFLVFLMGSSSPLHVQRFQRFIINVESTDHPENISPQNVGSFQLYGDNHTTFNEECVNTISEKDNQLKSEIFFMWSAPPPGSGCVTFRFNCIFRTFLITVVLVGFQSYDTWGFSTLVRWWWWSK